MEKYKILDHPADIKVQAFGRTKQELFSNALQGMAEILKPEKDLQIVNRKIRISSIDLDNLLVDFLSEVLYLSQTNKKIYNDVKFKRFGPSISSGQTILEGELFGNKIKSFGEDIKGVTYHGLKIEKKNGIYQATILFDI
jgi:SHS2 domain-containing protein